MQKFLCKIGCALQRELTNMLILAVWGLYLFALLGGKMQGNAVYTLRQCVTFGFFVLGAGLEYSLGDIDLCFMAQASLSTVWLGCCTSAECRCRGRCYIWRFRKSLWVSCGARWRRRCISL